MGGYDAWLESPYRDAEDEEIETEEALEEAQWDITNDLRKGSIENARDFVWEHLDEEKDQIVARLLYEYSRNLSNAASPEFARLVVGLLEDVVTKVAQSQVGVEVDEIGWLEGIEA